MWRVIVIPADNKLEVYELEIAETLEGLQAMVDGWIEHVIIGDCLTLARYEDIGMFVNEEGISLGKPVNQRASYLYGITVHGQCIHGDALITGEAMDPIDGRITCSVPEIITPKFFKLHFIRVSAGNS